MFWPLEVSLTTAREKIRKADESKGNNNNNNNKKAVVDAPCRSIAFFLSSWVRRRKASFAWIATGLWSRLRINFWQRAKKVVSDIPGLVDFAIGLVISILNLPDGQIKFFGRIQITDELKPMLIITATWNLFFRGKYSFSFVQIGLLGGLVPSFWWASSPVPREWSPRL